MLTFVLYPDVVRELAEGTVLKFRNHFRKFGFKTMQSIFQIFEIYKETEVFVTYYDIFFNVAEFYVQPDSYVRRLINDGNTRYAALIQDLAADKTKPFSLQVCVYRFTEGKTHKYPPHLLSLPLPQTS